MHDDSSASGDFQQQPSLQAKKKGPSLKARATDLLSRREHSRVELARKLTRYTDDPEEIAQLLDQLEQGDWLSNERFAQSLVHRRAAMKGTALIVQELKQHGLADGQIALLREALQGSELERARAVWQKKFGQAAATPARLRPTVSFPGFAGVLG